MTRRAKLGPENLVRNRALCFTLALIIAMAIASGFGVAEARASERHVKEIIAGEKARYPEGPSGSALCRKASAQRPPYSRAIFHEVNPATLAKDLPALMQESDEVVLAGFVLRSARVVSPSDEDAVIYHDVRVLRTWKGSHKVGDLLTFAFPTATINCDRDANHSAVTRTGHAAEGMQGDQWPFDVPYLLFLRHASTGMMEGLQLTGGDGTQGMFAIKGTGFGDQQSNIYACYRASLDHKACESAINFGECYDAHINSETIARCNAVLNESWMPVAMVLKDDPLREKYEGMPVSSFLKEVQTVVDSLSQAQKADSTKK